MRLRLRSYVPAVLVFVSLPPARAALTASPDGLTVYDSTHGINWVADGNLAAHNRFTLPLCGGGGPKAEPCVNAGGTMSYNSAVAWVQAMNVANFLGHSDWQMPVSPLVDPTCGKVGPNGASFGFGCTVNALATVYAQLGLKSPATFVPVTSTSLPPFRNIQPYLYWSSTQGSSPSEGYASFSFVTGFQGANTTPNFLYVMPMIRGKLPGVTATGNRLQPSADGQTVYDPVADATWPSDGNLAATNTFGLPRCSDPVTPKVCVAQSGAMTWDAANQFIANMNAAKYLGWANWELPPLDAGCTWYQCLSSPFGELFYGQFGLVRGQAAVAAPSAAAGPFQNIQPYLYWSCQGTKLQSACSGEPAPSFEWSFSFGNGFTGTDILPNEFFVLPYYAGAPRTGSGPAIASIANAEGESSTIAPNTWIEIKGANLAPAGDTRIWGSADFASNQMPASLDRIGVSINGKSAFVYYISPAQINVLTPPDAISGMVPVIVTNNSAVSAEFYAPALVLSPSLFVFDGGPYVAATHANGALLGPADLYPGLTMPAKPGETISLYANGFGPTSVAVASGSVAQSGALSSMPAVNIGNARAQVTFAGLVSPGLYQLNVVVPATASDGDQPITVTYNNIPTQPGTRIAIQR